MAMKFFILGLVCLFVALVFGMFNVVFLHYEGGRRIVAPNITNAGASLGFAVAGGLCVLASAISEKNGKL